MGFVRKEGARKPKGWPSFSHENWCMIDPQCRPNKASQSLVPGWKGSAALWTQLFGFHQINLNISMNGGTPKSSIFSRRIFHHFIFRKQAFYGTPPFLDTPYESLWKNISDRHVVRFRGMLHLRNHSLSDIFQENHKAGMSEFFFLLRKTRHVHIWKKFHILTDD